VAVDGSGNVYVVDQGNTRIQKFTDTGTFLTKWSIGVDAIAVTTDTSGHVFVAVGVAVTATSRGSRIPGPSKPSGPRGAPLQDRAGSSPMGGERLHQRPRRQPRPGVHGHGTLVTQWGSAGSGDGQFLEVDGLARNSGGDVFVADAQNTRIQRFTSTGTFLAKWGSAGSGNGQIGFTGPYGIAVDTSNNVFAADSTNHRIQKFACP